MNPFGRANPGPSPQSQLFCHSPFARSSGSTSASSCQSEFDPADGSRLPGDLEALQCVLIADFASPSNTFHNNRSKRLRRVGSRASGTRQI